MKTRFLLGLILSALQSLAGALDYKPSHPYKEGECKLSVDDQVEPDSVPRHHRAGQAPSDAPQVVDVAQEARYMLIVARADLWRACHEHYQLDICMDILDQNVQTFIEMREEFLAEIGQSGVDDGSGFVLKEQKKRIQLQWNECQRKAQQASRRAARALEQDLTPDPKKVANADAVTVEIRSQHEAAVKKVQNDQEKLLKQIRRDIAKLDTAEQEGAGNPKDAVESFKLHLAAEPNAKDKMQVQEEIGGLEYAAEKVRATGIEWVTIPGGSFTMGADLANEQPRHEVNVSTFQMAKTEVTFAQYQKCVAAGACTPPTADSPGGGYPVVGVDWNQAKAFSEWAGGRLASEAEWEYAARSAGKEQKYPWGDDEATCRRAVINEGGLGCGKNAAWPVCSKPEGNTQQGLCDMAGNVWEWTQDWHHDSYRGAPADGGAWEIPASSYRVSRGGSWSSNAEDARAMDRGRRDPVRRNDTLGFRPSRSR